MHDPNLLALRAVIVSATVYSVVPYLLSYPVASALRSRPERAHRAFDWMRRTRRSYVIALFFAGSVLGSLPLGFEPGVLPLSVLETLRAHTALGLLGALLVLVSVVCLHMTVLIESGFVLEARNREALSIHIHRRLDPDAMRDFEQWLRNTLTWCSAQGFTTVTMASHHLVNDRRRALVRSHLENNAAVREVREAAAFPMIPPTTIKFWIQFCRWPRGSGVAHHARSALRVLRVLVFRRKRALIATLR